MRLRINDRIAEEAILGGSFLGGGGGGSLREGLRMARIALEIGDVLLVDVDSIGEDEYIVTASIVGAPAARGARVTPRHMVRSTELLMRYSGLKLGGLISSENGGASTANGWIQAAMLGLPVVDAPADGRAHPTGVMGSMGLHRLSGYTSIQAAAGGDESAGRYLEVVASGPLSQVDKIIREAAVRAGGLVAVTRNPVKPSYVKENAAVGAISTAIEIGGIMRRHEGDALRIAEAVISYMGGGRILGEGRVESVELETRGGYDLGKVTLKAEGARYRLVFWNEYMAVYDEGGSRVAFFPDLIVTLSKDTGLPLTTAEIRKGDSVVLTFIPAEHIPLGAGVRDPEILAEVEKVVDMVL